jgi:LCP family protein required for cell wall assembly
VSEQSGADEQPARKRRAPRWARWAMIVGLVVVVLVGGGLGVAYALVGRYDKQIARQDLLPQASKSPTIAPTGKVEGPMNILVVGVDNSGNSRSYQGVYGTRSDTVMLVHLNKDLTTADAVSLPRDSYVHIPGHGDTKINAAFSYGGAPLLIQTVQDLLSITVDHVVVVNFDALRKVTDAVGGVDVVVDKTVKDDRTKYVFKKGVNHLDGRLAEIYVRQRYNLPGSDYDRIKRQQQFIRALADKATSTGVLANPFKLDDLLNAVTSSLTVDKAFPVRDLAFALRGMSLSKATFSTLPMSGSERMGGVDYEIPSQSGMRDLSHALRSDTMPAYLKKHPPNNVQHGA